MSSILIVEDEVHLAQGLRFNLEAEGYRVDTVETGEAALAQLVGAGARNYDVVVLDCMLPGIDGFAVAREIRGSGQFVPVLMLTARSQPEDILRGFESGADDYLPKPFELAILIARIRGLIRRRQWLESARETPSVRGDLFTFSGKTIDFDNLEIRGGDHTLRLTMMEAQLLRHLVSHEGRAVPRKQLLEEVWGLREDTDTRAIDNFVVRLRRYIELQPAKPRHLLTVRGIGYRFVADPPAP